MLDANQASRPENPGDLIQPIFSETLKLRAVRKEQLEGTLLSWAALAKVSLTHFHDVA